MTEGFCQFMLRHVAHYKHEMLLSKHAHAERGHATSCLPFRERSMSTAAGASAALGDVGILD